MKLSNIGGKKCLVCEDCGEIVWDLHGLKHGVNCTNCVDIARGVYKAVKIDKETLGYAGYDVEELSDEVLKQYVSELEEFIMSNVFWDYTETILNKHGIPRIDR